MIENKLILIRLSKNILIKNYKQKINKLFNKKKKICFHHLLIKKLWYTLMRLTYCLMSIRIDYN